MTADSCKIHEQIGDQFSEEDDRDGSFCIPDFGPGVFPEIYDEGLIPNLDAIGLNPGVTELAIWPELSRDSAPFCQEDPFECNALAFSDGPCGAEVKSIAQDPTSVHKEDDIPHGWVSGAAVRLSKQLSLPHIISQPGFSDLEVPSLSDRLASHSAISPLEGPEFLDPTGKSLVCEPVSPIVSIESATRHPKILESPPPRVIGHPFFIEFLDSIPESDPTTLQSLLGIGREQSYTL
ncbi:hypothetical protein PG987_004787 [Apiospora arundinis]